MLILARTVLANRKERLPELHLTVPSVHETSNPVRTENQSYQLCVRLWYVWEHYTGMPGPSNGTD